MTSTRSRQHVAAPPESVYRALLDADAIAKWRVPSGMTCRVHRFEPRVGGAVEVSLTYDAPDRVGKTTSRTDTYRGRFVELVPNRRVVEVDAFITDDPDLRGEMTITLTLTEIDGGTEVIAVHDGVPRGVVPADNELGWRMALAKLAALVEAKEDPGESRSGPATA